MERIIVLSDSWMGGAAGREVRPDDRSRSYV